jgi:hypothetical protein
MSVWNLEVDRVRLVGAQANGLQPAELRVLVESAVRNAFASSPLPKGRAMVGSVRVDVQSLGGGTAIAGAVASAVSQTIGPRNHG